MDLTPNTIIDLQHKLDKLKKDHQYLSDEIDRIRASSMVDDLRVHRLKKEKLLLKDQIAKIDGMLTPDIIA
jgi:hypothetical protein